MIDIIEEIYYGNVQEVFRKTSEAYKKASKIESAKYDKLAKILNEEQLKLLNEYIEAILDSNEIEVKDRYKQGFKTGLLIGIESRNIEL